MERSCGIWLLTIGWLMIDGHWPTWNFEKWIPVDWGILCAKKVSKLPKPSKSSLKSGSFREGKLSRGITQKFFEVIKQTLYSWKAVQPIFLPLWEKAVTNIVKLYFVAPVPGRVVSQALSPHEANQFLDVSHHQMDRNFQHIINGR